MRRISMSAMRIVGLSLRAIAMHWSTDRLSVSADAMLWDMLSDCENDDKVHPNAIAVAKKLFPIISQK